MPSTSRSARAKRRVSAIAPSISANARRARSSSSDPASVSSTRRVVRTNNTTPRSRSSSRIERDRRLRHVQTLRRPPKMELFRYSDEIAQLPQLDRKVHTADTDPRDLAAPVAAGSSSSSRRNEPRFRLRCVEPIAALQSYSIDPAIAALRTKPGRFSEHQRRSARGGSACRYARRAPRESASTLTDPRPEAVSYPR